MPTFEQFIEMVKAQYVYVLEKDQCITEKNAEMPIVKVTGKVILLNIAQYYDYNPENTRYIHISQFGWALVRPNKFAERAMAFTAAQTYGKLTRLATEILVDEIIDNLKDIFRKMYLRFVLDRL